MRASQRNRERIEAFDAEWRDQLHARPPFRLLSFYSFKIFPLSHKISDGYFLSFDAARTRHLQSAGRSLRATFDIASQIRLIRVALRFPVATPSGSPSATRAPLPVAVPVPTHINPAVIARGAVETLRHLQTFDKRHQGKAVARRKDQSETLAIAPFGQLAAALAIGFFGGGAGVFAYEHGFFDAWARLWTSTPASPQAALTADPAQKASTIVAIADAPIQPVVAPIDATSATRETIARAPQDQTKTASDDATSLTRRTPGPDARTAQRSDIQATVRKQRLKSSSGHARHAGGRAHPGRAVDSKAEAPRNFLETFAQGLRSF